ncbi:hypothetical protein M513_08731 [Trichuris suis]|uniref:Uncharacterized protein n=1 Tax=Trichuris suis TaxID=68888 RepID=A0A085LZF3_9BILA|nr:hypothetical protein M513_08731 [Trichuris suis]
MALVTSLGITSSRIPMPFCPSRIPQESLCRRHNDSLTTGQDIKNGQVNRTISIMKTFGPVKKHPAFKISRVKRKGVKGDRLMSQPFHWLRTAEDQLDDFFLSHWKIARLHKLPFCVYNCCTPFYLHEHYYRPVILTVGHVPPPQDAQMVNGTLRFLLTYVRNIHTCGIIVWDIGMQFVWCRAQVSCVLRKIKLYSHGGCMQTLEADCPAPPLQLMNAHEVGQ